MSSEPVVPVNSPADLDEGRTDRREPVPIDRRLPVDSEITSPEIAATTPGPSRVVVAAEAVGTAVGKAILKIRGVPGRVSEARERLSIVRERTQEGAESSAVELREAARTRFDQVRYRTEYYAHERPIEFILAVGGASFVLGFLLRFWRSSRRA